MRSFIVLNRSHFHLDIIWTPFSCTSGPPLIRCLRCWAATIDPFPRQRYSLGHLMQHPDPIQTSNAKEWQYLPGFRQSWGFPRILIPFILPIQGVLWSVFAKWVLPTKPYASLNLLDFKIPPNSFTFSCIRGVLMLDLPLLPSVRFYV